MSGELLLEVRTEEIPARMLPGAARQLASRLFEELVARGLTPSELEAGHTPRRLWLVMQGVPARERDRRVLEIGPPVQAAFDGDGQPTRAANGFAKKFGVEVGELSRRDFSQQPLQEQAGEKGSTPKGERIVLDRLVVGRTTTEILTDLIPEVLTGLTWAKTMKWGGGVGPWVRPVHGVVALFDGELVPFELFDVRSGVESAGHSTLSPASFVVTGVDDWRSRLAERGVVPSPEQRLAALRSGMAAQAADAGGTLVEDAELLAKLAATCEIPGVMAGAFDAAMLDLPREVLVTALRDHQSALTVERDGALLPLFLTVMDRPDDPTGRVRAGNEWVVAARLADARFFWEKDRSRTLAARVSDLADLGFHRQLGSYADKAVRLEAICAEIATVVGLEDGEKSSLMRAAALAKVDLTTEMVREFTSLQGVVGGVYAREQGEPEAVWTAIYDQYLPASTDDALPRARTGRVLALADRIDTLVGFFGLGLIPTGSRDPFALRRAAQSALRIVLEGGIDVSLPALVAASHATYAEQTDKSRDETWTTLRPFFEDRLRYLFQLGGFAYDEIEAGLKRPGEELADLGALGARIAALHAAREDRDFLSVVLAAKRIANITKDQADGGFEPAALELPAERNLGAVAGALEGELEQALGTGDFAAGIAAVARLAPSLEAFFEQVLVMDQDERKRSNRIGLLRSIGRSIGRLADLSELVVDKADYR